ncbi:MAG: LacI family DNA-binding transcriptional regulator [Acidobacteriaceae bacterium]|nr:LacI family DNA-binding transcriptional regulator [Acidobacteriaceae bacterium]
MKDIAEDLGVSLMTVSKALRGHVDISEDTRERILRRARELNYQPNWVARSLATRRTFIVGLVIPDLMHSFFAEIAYGLTRELAPFGYQIVLANSDENAETERRELDLLIARKIDGLVVASAQRDWRRGIPQALKNISIPFVLIDRMPSGPRMNYVGTCDEDLGMLATEHLISQGCVRLAHIHGPDNPNSLGRLRGFQSALKKNGMKSLPQCVVEGGVKDEDGYEAMQQLLRLKTPPDGVFCYNDPVAAGAIKAVLESGRGIPGDIAIVGAGNVHYSDLLRVPLSTIDQRASEIGEQAARILVECMRTKSAPSPKCVLIPPRLIIRDSSRRSDFSNLGQRTAMRAR